ncbi:DUF2797 domain-containing protein [Streptacidiphilus sp. PB12-B1b]|uniref:DUF2797 domain-containing protein n=1 Tax=Streptacidiphilus sp. PB12-B1b TaxID=2705012 RepID=UPI0015FB8E0D|nr:DUF2797 domain-containing protein [Streptacidiphilus sp. PB12-B1b]QMU78752.1 DUF2797 domain-containing protein [Streptacidiphilus sp. PB12-B1b]
MVSDVAPAVWRAVGVAWRDGAAVLTWWAPGGGAPRSSRLDLGAELAFTTGADRLCTGVWRAGRRHGCPTGAHLAASARSAQCPACQAIDRADSIAADTRLHDPRPFAVYLAHHGGAVKVGITAVERGDARLLEQGALASAVISSGTLTAARRVENLLGAALGLPDRMSATRKRAARVRPGTAAERAADLLAAAERTQALTWPEGQTRREPLVADHAAAYGLPARGLQPVAAMLPPGPGEVIAGRIACRIGSDLYLDAEPGLVLLDTRLLAGWALGRAEPGAALTVPLEPCAAPDRPDDQDALF